MKLVKMPEDSNVDYKSSIKGSPKSKATDQLEESKVSSKGSKGKKNSRRRKNKGQIKALEEEFNKNPHWTNEDVDRISDTLKLDKSQVYKWNWDQKKKMNILPSKVYVMNMNGQDVDVSSGNKIVVKSKQELEELQKMIAKQKK